jgi:hypothetical protein
MKMVIYRSRVVKKAIKPNVLHKTSKGMRDMNYQDTQHFGRDTMPKLPLKPLLVLCGVSSSFLFTN